MLAKRLSQRRLLLNRERSQDLLGYVLPYTLPALICLPLTLYVSHFLPVSVGRALALCFAYATSSGIFSTSMLLCVIVHVQHRPQARGRCRSFAITAPRPLFLIGFLAALSDALTSPQIARQLGGNHHQQHCGVHRSVRLDHLRLAGDSPAPSGGASDPQSAAGPTPQTACAARIPADFFRALVLADSADGAGLGDQPDRRRR